MESIGVRVLRQYASVYLRRVKAGETIEVTERGRSVALLVPSPKGRFEALVESGVLVPAARPPAFDLDPPVDTDFDATGALDAVRRDER